MRPNGRTPTVVMAGLMLALLLSAGCASRKQVSTTQATPPPPPVETKPETPPPPPSPPPQEKPEETKMALQDAFFDFDDFSLRSDAKAALDADGKYLEKNSSANVIIEGHCDERGSVEYNLALGEKRARAAKDYLVSFGIKANRLTTISYGKERPFDSGHSEDAWSKNRRAHFVTK